MKANIYERKSGYVIQTKIEKIAGDNIIIEQEESDLDIQIVVFSFDDIEFLYNFIHDNKNAP